MYGPPAAVRSRGRAPALSFWHLRAHPSKAIGDPIARGLSTQMCRRLWLPESARGSPFAADAWFVTSSSRGICTRPSNRVTSILHVARTWRALWPVKAHRIDQTLVSAHAEAGHGRRLSACLEHRSDAATSLHPAYVQTGAWRSALRTELRRATRQSSPRRELEAVNRAGQCSHDRPTLRLRGFISENSEIGVRRLCRGRRD